MGMNIANVKRNYATPVLDIWRAVNSYTLYARNCLHSIFCNINLVLPYPVHADAIQVVDGGPKANHICNVWRAGLKPVWKVVVPGLLLMDFFDHVSAAQERRHFLKNVSFYIENPNACRPEHLVGRECHKIAIHLPDIDWHMRHRLRPVNHYRNPFFVRHLDNIVYRVYSPKNV